MIRKSLSKKERERKEKRNQKILGIILVFIMFGSVFGVVLNEYLVSRESKLVEDINYKGFNFVNNLGIYELNLDENLTFYFSESPRKYEIIPYEINLNKTIQDIYLKPIYIDSTDYYSSSEIVRNLGNYAQRIQFACLNEEDCIDESFPIKTCNDNILVIKESETNKIYSNENCIFIEGKVEDLVALTDITILNLIGIK